MSLLNYKIMTQITNKIIPKIRVPLSSSIIRNQLDILSQQNNCIRYVSNEASVKEDVLINKTEQQRNQSQKQQQSDSPGILKISESCLKRLKEVCSDGSFLRVTVEGGGCSGFTYKFDLDTKLNDGDDIIFGNDKNGKVVIDKTSLEYCSGATVDYHIELIRAGFRITNNPKAETGCSCGASFALRLD